jgi:hypothetical protein
MGKYGMMGLLDNIVKLNLVKYLHGVTNGLGAIGEKSSHLIFAFEVFLKGVTHTVGLTEFFASIQADENIVSWGIVGHYKMNIVGGNALYAGFHRKFSYSPIHLELIFIYLVVDSGFARLMKHEFKIEIIAKYFLVLVNKPFSAFHIAVQDCLWDFASKAGT